jgi:hypothetical protein
VIEITFKLPQGITRRVNLVARAAKIATGIGLRTSSGSRPSVPGQARQAAARHDGTVDNREATIDDAAAAATARVHAGGYRRLRVWSLRA